MAVIRQDEARRVAQEAIALDLGDLQRQGEAILARARARAEQAMQDARAERERLMAGAEQLAAQRGQAIGIERGLVEGRAQGEAKALQSRKVELAALEKAWMGALESFEAQRARMLQDAREDVLRLALLLTRRITLRTLEVDPSIVRNLLEEVLASVARPTRLTIAVHPADADLCRAALPGLLSRFASVTHAEVVEDASLARGSCVARTAGGGEIDASLDVQLRRIAEAMLPGVIDRASDAGSAAGNAGGGLA